MPIKGVSQSFRDRADSACFWEAWVGAVLSRAGLYTLHYPFEIDGKDHSQSFDLLVGQQLKLAGLSPFGDNLSGTTVEVKSVNLTFTCPDDYPFPKVLVCSQNSWLHKWPGRDYTCRDFLLVSRVTGAIIWIPHMSKVELGVEITDNSRSETYKAVQTDSENLQPLGDFIDHIKA